MSEGGLASQIHTDTYWNPQVGPDLVTGVLARLMRTGAFTIAGSGTNIEGKDVNQGHVQSLETNKNMSDGTNLQESGTDEGTEQGAWFLLSCLRTGVTVPPALLSVTGSFTVATGVTLSTGEIGVTITITGTSFAAFLTQADVPIRIFGSALPENNRNVVVQAFLHPAADDVLEIVPGYTEGPAPAGTPKIFYGTPMTAETATLTVQIGNYATAGSAPLACFSFYQRMGNFDMKRHHAANSCVPGDLEIAVTPDSNIAYSGPWNGGGCTFNSQLDQSQAPAGGDYDNGSVTVDGAVAAGATSITMAGGSSTGSVSAGDQFSVVGSEGVYTFEAAGPATAGALTATFAPAVLAGGDFTDTNAVTFHGATPPFTPAFMAPVGKSTGTGDGNPGGLHTIGIVPHGTQPLESKKAIHFSVTSEGLGGATGLTISLASNNSRQDSDLETEPKDTIPGTMRFSASLPLGLKEDAFSDRPAALTKLGIKEFTQKVRFDLIWTFALHDGQTIPDQVWWHFAAAQIKAFSWPGGEGDGMLEATIEMDMKAHVSNAPGNIEIPEGSWSFMAGS
jgi:hypothetical protein